MLVIRNRQLVELGASDIKQFVEKTTDHVSRIFPGQVPRLGVESVQNLIRSGIKKAADYGITRERDVAMFVDLMFGLEQDFDRNQKLPWIRNILDNEKLTGRAKIHLIYERLKTANQD